jgi:serine/threonine-protein kinase
MDPKEVARCMEQVADAVHHLHQQGIVHRDLKPSNVLMDGENRPRVTDFGLARMADVKGLTLDSASIIGTPGYMAPELVLGTSQGDARSDVYSLGAILYELLTGQPLFEKESVARMLLKVMGANPKPPRVVCPGVPPELEQICLKSLRKEPGKRYGSAGELAEDLARFLRSEPVEARAPDLWHAMGQWMRRKPGLGARLVGLAVFFLVHLLIRFSGIDASLEPEFTLQLGGIFLFWGCASVVLQSLLDRGYRSNLVHRMWMGADILCLTGLLLTIGSGPQSPVITAYLLIVVVSGIWFDARLVWFTTGLATLGFLVLVLEVYLNPSRSEYRMEDKEAAYVVFVTMVMFTGFFVARQARRVSALSRFCARGPEQ